MLSRLSHPKLKSHLHIFGDVIMVLVFILTASALLKDYAARARAQAVSKTRVVLSTNITYETKLIGSSDRKHERSHE